MNIYSRFPGVYQIHPYYEFVDASLELSGFHIWNTKLIFVSDKIRLLLRTFPSTVRPRFTGPRFTETLNLRNKSKICG